MAILTCKKCGQVQMSEIGKLCLKCGAILGEAGTSQQREASGGQEIEDQIRKCPKCGRAESSKTAKFCSRCGAALPTQDKAETAKAPKNKTSDLIAGYLFLGVISFAIVAGVLNYCGEWYRDYKFEKKMEEWRESNPYTTEDIYDDEDDDSDYTYSGGTYHYGSSTDVSDDYKLALFTLAQEEVKNRLKSPSSAKFPINYLGDEVQYERNGDRYTIASWVEAENSFGAILRQQFMLSTTISGGKMKDIICIIG